MNLTNERRQAPQSEGTCGPDLWKQYDCGVQAGGLRANPMAGAIFQAGSRADRRPRARSKATAMLQPAQASPPRTRRGRQSIGAGVVDRPYGRIPTMRRASSGASAMAHGGTRIFSQLFAAAGHMHGISQERPVLRAAIRGRPDIDPDRQRLMTLSSSERPPFSPSRTSCAFHRCRGITSRMPSQWRHSGVATSRQIELRQFQPWAGSVGAE